MEDSKQLESQLTIGAQALAALAALNLVLRSEMNLDIFESMVSTPQQKDMLTKAVGVAGAVSLFSIFMKGDDDGRYN